MNTSLSARSCELTQVEQLATISTTLRPKYNYRVIFLTLAYYLDRLHLTIMWSIELRFRKYLIVTQFRGARVCRLSGNVLTHTCKE